MAFTQSDLDAIETAIKSGHSTVEFNGRKVTYQNTADMMRIRDMIRGELDAANLRLKPRYKVADFSG